jgi:hypothetical protein
MFAIAYMCAFFFSTGKAPKGREAALIKGGYKQFYIQDLRDKEKARTPWQYAQRTLGKNR